MKWNIQNADPGKHEREQLHSPKNAKPDTRPRGAMVQI